MISTLDVSTQCQWKIRLFVDYASMIKTNPRNFEGISTNINFSKTTQIEKKTDYWKQIMTQGNKKKSSLQ